MTVQDLPLFKAALRKDPRPPAGYVGRVLERMRLTTVHSPITPIDLAKSPDLYGTAFMRNLRFVRKWLKENTKFTIAYKTAQKGRKHWKYWLALKD